MAMAMANARATTTRCVGKTGARKRIGCRSKGGVKGRTQAEVGKRGWIRRGRVCRATEEERTRTDATGKDSSAGDGGPQAKEEKSGLKEGQGTAIVTGAISLILGVAYLALTLWLDQRGAQLQPPPPEAYLP